MTEPERAHGLLDTCCNKSIAVVCRSTCGLKRLSFSEGQLLLAVATCLARRQCTPCRSYQTAPASVREQGLIWEWGSSRIQVARTVRVFLLSSVDRSVRPFPITRTAQTTHSLQHGLWAAGHLALPARATAPRLLFCRLLTGDGVGQMECVPRRCATTYFFLSVVPATESFAVSAYRSTA